MDRRSFVVQLGGFAAVATLTPFVAGCPADDTDSETDSETETETDSEAACDNCADSAAEGPADMHDHRVCLSQAEVDGGDVTITSEGGSHEHTVPITAAELTTLRDTGTVTVSSTSDHPHTWVITLCA